MAKLLAPKEVAEIYGLPLNATLEVMKSKNFPVVKLGKCYFVHEENAENFFKSRQIIERTDFRPRPKR